MLVGEERVFSEELPGFYGIEDTRRLFKLKRHRAFDQEVESAGGLGDVSVRRDAHFLEESSDFFEEGGLEVTPNTLFGETLEIDFLLEFME